MPPFWNDSPVLSTARFALTWLDDAPLKRLLAITLLKVKVLLERRLLVGPDVLVAESGIRARAGEKIRIDPGAERGELRKTSCAERQGLNLSTVENIAIRRVGGIQQRCRIHFDRCADRSCLELHIECGGAVRLHLNRREVKRIESIMRERQGVRTCQWADLARGRIHCFV